MTRPDEDDREAVDRAFAEIMAGYHRTAERAAEVATEPPLDPTPAPAPSAAPEHGWADEHPLFRFPTTDEPAPEPTPVEPEGERYVPEPMPPLQPPALPALLGWLGIGWAALVVLAAAFGARFPAWVGWVAIVGFLAGFTVLVARLPRHRPPGSGDGAVL